MTSPDGPLKGPLRPLGGALSALYRIGLDHKTRDFDAGRRVITIDRPVISVGNLSVGGTGKTPVVAWIVRTLRAGGRTPAIAMRGYRSVGGVSDEADAYRRAFPELQVVAQPDRLEGLFRMFAGEEGRLVDCVVLDDGFQHRRIARQLDLVLIDATRSPFEDALLPVGWLRETPDALARASGVVLTHADRVPASRLASLAGQIERAGAPVLAATAHAWSGLDVHENGQDRTEPVAWLRQRRVAVVCALGRPESVLHAARGAIGAEPVGTLLLRDHDPYGPGTLARIDRLLAESRADVLLTTDKDWSKLGRPGTGVPEGRFRAGVVRPRLGLAFLSGEDRLAGLVRRTAERDPDDGPVEIDGRALAGPYDGA